MAEIVIEKLVRNGWPEDSPREMIEESLLEKTTGELDDDNEYTTWIEWRLDNKIVKRSADVKLKRNVLAEGIAAMLGS